MANELRTAITLECTREALVRGWPRKTVTSTLAGQNFVWTRKAIGVAAEALPLDEVTSGGFWILSNRSTTAGEIISLRSGALGANFAVLNPGEECLVRWTWLADGASAPHAISALGTPILEYLAFDP